MPSRPADAVLLDLDGTLVDTAPDIADALNAARAGEGLPPVDEREVRRHIGQGTRALVQHTLGGAGAPGLVGRLLDGFQRHYAACCGRRGRLFPGVAPALAGLRRAGVRLALVTNKETRFAGLVLRAHGLDEAFELRVCGDTLAAKKPDRSVVAHCLARLGVAPESALLVGDSDVDVQTARNGGVLAWAVNYGYNGERPIEDACPDRVIASLAELLEPA